MLNMQLIELHVHVHVSTVLLVFHHSRMKCHCTPKLLPDSLPSFNLKVVGLGTRLPQSFNLAVRVVLFSIYTCSTWWMVTWSNCPPVCQYVCLCLCMCTCVGLYVYVAVSLSICFYLLCMYMTVFVYLSVCVFVYMCGFVYVCGCQSVYMFPSALYVHDCLSVCVYVLSICLCLYIVN